MAYCEYGDHETDADIANGMCINCGLAEAINE